MDEIATFNTAVVAANQAIADAQAVAQAHGDLSDEYLDALNAQYDAAQAVLTAFGAAYGNDDGPPSEQVQQAMQNTQRLIDQARADMDSFIARDDGDVDSDEPEEPGEHIGGAFGPADPRLLNVIHREPVWCVGSF